MLVVQSMDIHNQHLSQNNSQRIWHSMLKETSVSQQKISGKQKQHSGNNKQEIYHCNRDLIPWKCLNSALLPVYKTPQRHRLNYRFTLADVLQGYYASGILSSQQSYNNKAIIFSRETCLCILLTACVTISHNALILEYLFLDFNILIHHPSP